MLTILLSIWEYICSIHLDGTNQKLGSVEEDDDATFDYSNRERDTNNTRNQSFLDCSKQWSNLIDFFTSLASQRKELK
ncbi:hypothetical protein MKW98_004018 [Papaver atlanticum]|uniref:Uncharacterized protein n=1 Tax=Papaver atlanticum TaxID=357466 RepID=A0AAD4T0G9_9MAGN|nr:hypothetical protein MKW98_004018 [Papaver atlanticum]